MVVKRIRDKIRNFKPQEVISYNEWQDITARFVHASEILKTDNPAYQILISDLENAEDMVLTNRVREVKEVKIIGDIQRIFSTPKEEQMNELVGQIKYIRAYIAELTSWVDRQISLEHMEAEGKIIIRRTQQEALLDERP